MRLGLTENLTENKYMQCIGCYVLSKEEGEKSKTKLYQIAEENKKEVRVWGRMNGKRLIPLLNSFLIASQAPLTSYISFANYTVQPKQPGLKSHRC